MAYAMMQTIARTTWAEYEAVNARVSDPPPEGLIVHAAGAFGDGIRTVDLWDSREEWERFRETRLLPALLEVIGPERVLSDVPAVEEFEAAALLGPFPDG